MSLHLSAVGRNRREFTRKLKDAIERCGKSHNELAQGLGYDSQNIISMFKSGKTRVPLVKVPVLARLVGLDASALLREWFAAYEPEALPVIEAHFGAGR